MADEEEYISKVAQTPEEIQQLIEAGFDYMPKGRINLLQKEEVTSMAASPSASKLVKRLTLPEVEEGVA